MPKKQEYKMCIACQGTGLHGNEFEEAVEPDMGTEEWEEGLWRCPSCNGEGYVITGYDYSTGEQLKIVDDFYLGERYSKLYEW